MPNDGVDVGIGFLQPFCLAIVGIGGDDATAAIGGKEVAVHPYSSERFFVPSHGIEACAHAGKPCASPQLVDIENRFPVDIQRVASLIFQFGAALLLALLADGAEGEDE